MWPVKVYFWNGQHKMFYKAHKAIQFRPTMYNDRVIKFFSLFFCFLGEKKKKLPGSSRPLLLLLRLSSTSRLIAVIRTIKLRNHHTQRNGREGMKNDSISFGQGQVCCCCCCHGDGDVTNQCRFNAPGRLSRFRRQFSSS